MIWQKFKKKKMQSKVKTFHTTLTTWHSWCLPFTQEVISTLLLNLLLAVFARWWPRNLGFNFWHRKRTSLCAARLAAHLLYCSMGTCSYFPTGKVHRAWDRQL